MSKTTSNEVSKYMTFTDFQARLAGASKSWMYARLAAGEIPPPVRFGGRALWLRSVIEAWESQIEAEQLAKLESTQADRVMA